MTKIYQQPFAHAGTKQVIPDASDPQGFVSNADGFTTDYELPDTDPNYKPIERAEFNGLMNMVTESLGEIQQFGFAKWQAITWPQGARVVEGGIVYRALVQTSQQPPHADWLDDSATQIGTIINGYTIPYNCVVAFGGEFLRADYPRLWVYLQTNPSLVKTESQWQTESTANNEICGYFSDGNGSTTFRVPNLNKAFLRPDSRAVGSYQSDVFKSHNHTIFAGTVGIGVSPVAGSYGVMVNPTSSSTENTGGGETSPKNIAVLPLIVAK